MTAQVNIEQPERARYRGIAAPITKKQGDYWKSVPTLDLVWSSIVLILGTPLGTRIMLPEFGSLVPTLVFEPNDEALVALGKRYVIDAIDKWEPRVTLRDVSIIIEEHTFSIYMIYIVSGFVGEYEGRLIVYRNQSYEVLESFYRET